MANKLQLTIDLAAQKAIDALKNLQKATKGVGEELDDTKSAGKRVAEELNRATDSIIADLKASEQAAQALADALGPEMAASIGQSTIDSFVGDLKRLGLTTDEVKADANDLADALKHSADAADSVGDVDRAMTHLGETTDNTRSVVANFAGNAAQELPGVADALGPLNMAIGQFAEYASEGNIKLKNFAAAGAGLAVAALAMKGIQDRMAKIAEIDAFQADRIKGYEDAIADADSSVLAIKQHLEDAGKIEFLTGDANGGFWTGGVATITDVTSAMTRLGLTTTTAASLIAGGETKIREWGDAMIDSGVKTETVAVVMGTLIAEAEAFDEAAANAKVTNDWLGRSMDDAGESAKGMAKDVRDDRDALVEAERATRDLDAAYNDLIGGLDREDAWNGILEKLWALKDGTGDSAQEARDLTRDYADFITKAEEIPAEKKTELLAQLNEGDLAVVQAYLESLMKGVTVPVRFAGQGNVGFTKNATGTSWSAGGPTLVGEQGPEIVNMPRGASVMSAGQTARMRQRGGGAQIGTVIVQTNDPPRRWLDELSWRVT